jgi:Family of unknown function (DUF5985)
MHNFLAGVITMGCWTVGLMFLRLWRDSGERLFAMFGAAFWALALNWVALTIVTPAAESRHVFYLIRLAAFALIILGIIDKNRPRGQHDE